MDLNREKMAEALENAIRTVVPVEGVVKMSGGVAQMVVEMLREPVTRDTATSPRVIPLDELLCTHGHGYLEMKYPPDELGEDPVEAIEECVWLNGEVLSKPEIGGYNHFPRKSIADGYGSVKGGMRIWDWNPTDEERKAVKWDERPGEGHKQF